MKEDLINKKYFSSSVEQTEEIGYNIGKALEKGDIIAFSGNLGAGKTALTRGIAKGIGYDGEVTSPTYTILQIYDGLISLCHFDMYRVESKEDLISTGFFDYLDDEMCMAIEWSENIAFALPKNVIKINISYGETENDRIIEVGD
ncbi:MAG: tRNA (adenosine(37)-N6)-threonylcarbamoyltransferase complex ATPase subunit type 1 TsaE [Clostridia bacterium]